MKLSAIAAFGLCFAVALSAAAPDAEAGTVVVGAAATDRALADSFSDFAIAFTDTIFPTGTITGWEVFIERFDGTDRQVGLLVLEQVSGNNYKVNGIDLRTVGLGLNLSGPVSIDVTAGEILAVFMADAKVSYDLINQPSGDDIFTANGAIAVTPTLGQTLSLSQGSTERIYSINATVSQIPVPAALPLLLSGLAGLGFVARRRRAAA